MRRDNRSLELGCPIRKFSDQSLFAAPQDLSQRTTSFIASQRQGIHRTPFWHLILARNQKTEPGDPFCKSPTSPSDRKDQFCFKHIRKPRGQAKGLRLVLTETRRQLTKTSDASSRTPLLPPPAISCPRPDALPLHNVNLVSRPIAAEHAEAKRLSSKIPPRAEPLGSRAKLGSSN